MAKMKLKYPKTIYIGIEHERDTSFFTAFADPTEVADLADEREIAVYELVKKAKVRTKVEVV